MDQPDRTRQRNLAALDDDHLALDAAQPGAGVAGVDAAAIDHRAVEVVRRALAIEFDRHAGGGETCVQAPAARAAARHGLRPRNRAPRGSARAGRARARRVRPRHALVAAGQAGEAVEVGAVARVRHHQRAVERGLRDFVAPELERTQSKPRDQRLAGLALAVRRQHAAGPMAGGLRHRGVAALVQRDLAAGLGEHQRLPGADDAGADDIDRCCCGGVAHFPSLRRHDPDQVQRVTALAVSQLAGRAPLGTRLM